MNSAKLCNVVVAVVVFSTVEATVCLFWSWKQFTLHESLCQPFIMSHSQRLLTF